MDSLNPVADAIRATFVARNTARDLALSRSRDLIRQCAEAIRATHRREWENAQTRLDAIRAAADLLREGVTPYPDLLTGGYTFDALKEMVEAHCTYAIVRGEALPTPETLRVEGDVYLNGLAEAASELRRAILDMLRRDDGDPPATIAEAERLMAVMDVVYDQLVTFDFPDAITGDLRRRTDQLRGVLERTRGDLTTTIRQQRLQAALQRLETRVLRGKSEV